MNTIKDIAKQLDWTEAKVRHNLAYSLGKTEEWWRCGATGTISEGPYECSCDSILCDLGESVTVIPTKDII